MSELTKINFNRVPQETFHSVWFLSMFFSEHCILIISVL